MACRAWAKEKQRCAGAPWRLGSPLAPATVSSWPWGSHGPQKSVTFLAVETLIEFRDFPVMFDETRG